VFIGVAATPDQGADANEVLRAADKSLYQAKSEGLRRGFRLDPG
jgi:GGDEF domain-containing protein